MEDSDCVSKEECIIIEDSPVKTPIAAQCITISDSPVKTPISTRYITISDSPIKDYPQRFKEDEKPKQVLAVLEGLAESKYIGMPQSDSEDNIADLEELSESKYMELSQSDSEDDISDPKQCPDCKTVFSKISNRNRHVKRKLCKFKQKRMSTVKSTKRNTGESTSTKDMTRKKLTPEIWAGCDMQEVTTLPHDIDGTCCYKLQYDKNAMMKSTVDGRPWCSWITSNRSNFQGVRRIASCSGTYECVNEKCPYKHSFTKNNKVNFERQGENVNCACCGYVANRIPCLAKKVWEFNDAFVNVYHYGNHTCIAKKVTPSIRKEAAEFFKANNSAKPCQFPYESLRKMLKEGKSVTEVYDNASKMAKLKDIQNVKQQVMKEINPAGHSFEALAKIKSESDKHDKYLLWAVQDGRLSKNKLTYVFRTSKERIEVAALMQRDGMHPLAKEFCYLDAEHDKVLGMKTINLSVQHPTLKEMVTLASMDCDTESKETLCEFWSHLNSALTEFTGNAQYIFDPHGIVSDEHGGNRASIQIMLKEELLERSKSCEVHFYDCAHKVSKGTWSPRSKAEFLEMVHAIYCAETPTAYEVKRRTLMDWAKEKDKRKHVKNWFNNFWHARRFHVFRAFKGPDAPNTNMAEVGHSRNAVRGAKRDSLSRVAEDHIVESALLKAKLKRFEEGSYSGGNCHNQRQKDMATLRRQLDRASQFAKDLGSNNLNTEAYKAGTHIEERSSHRVKQRAVSMQSIVDDLSGSDDDNDDGGGQTPHIRSTHRKRKTRSKAFHESLKKAKYANIMLKNVHHISDYHKVFEVEQSHKTRLVHIGETVECDCSFAAGGDICHHVVWVMLKVLNVQEQDTTLHQKVHTKASLKQLLHHMCSNQNPTTTHSPSTSDGLSSSNHDVNMVTQTLGPSTSNGLSSSNHGINMVSRALGPSSSNGLSSSNHGINMASRTLGPSTSNGLSSSSHDVNMVTQTLGPSTSNGLSSSNHGINMVSRTLGPSTSNGLSSSSHDVNMVTQTLGPSTSNGLSSSNHGINMVSRTLGPSTSNQGQPVSSFQSTGGYRQPWHNSHPFMITSITNRVKKCAGCPYYFRDPMGPPFLGLVIQHLEKDVYMKNGVKHISTESNRYYHCLWECVRARHPYISPSMIHCAPGLMLDAFQEEFLMDINMYTP